MQDAISSLDEQDEIKELASKWLLESSYVLRAVEGTLKARGHTIRSQNCCYSGFGVSTVKMDVQLKQGTGTGEAHELIEFVEQMTGKHVAFSTEMSDHGQGFAPAPNRLSFEMMMPVIRNNAATTMMRLLYNT